MVATYEKTVQNAFAEVSDALATVGTVNRQCAALKDLVNATETAYRLSQSRYKNGLDGFLTVLESQRQMVAAQTNYISAESNRLSSGVMLYKAVSYTHLAVSSEAVDALMTAVRANRHMLRKSVISRAPVSYTHLMMPTPAGTNSTAR